MPYNSLNLVTYGLEKIIFNNPSKIKVNIGWKIISKLSSKAILW
jgi:hypothetical protein